MPEYADIYVLAKERSSDAVREFLDHFLPVRRESADAYEVPQYSDTPHAIFKDVNELIAYCSRNPQETYAVYWQSPMEHLHAEAYFLKDGGLILGISTPAENQAKVDAMSHELSSFLSTDEVIVTYEDLPPESMDDFHLFFASLPIITDAASAQAARGTRAHRLIRLI